MSTEKSQLGSCNPSTSLVHSRGVGGKHVHSLLTWSGRGDLLVPLISIMRVSQGSASEQFPRVPARSPATPLTCIGGDLARLSPTDSRTCGVHRGERGAWVLSWAQGPAPSPPGARPYSQL